MRRPTRETCKAIGSGIALGWIIVLSTLSCAQQTGRIETKKKQESKGWFALTEASDQQAEQQGLVNLNYAVAGGAGVSLILLWMAYKAFLEYRYDRKLLETLAAKIPKGGE